MTDYTEERIDYGLRLARQCREQLQQLKDNPDAPRVGPIGDVWDAVQRLETANSLLKSLLEKKS